MKKYILVSLVCFLALASAVNAADFDDKTIQGLNVTTDIDAALDTSQKENKTLVIIFDQDSCVYCDIFKEDVLSDGDVQRVLNSNFTVLLLDINKNPDIAEKYDIFGTPSVQFVDSSGKEITKIEGYVDGDEFLKVLKGI